MNWLHVPWQQHENWCWLSKNCNAPASSSLNVGQTNETSTGRFLAMASTKGTPNRVGFPCLSQATIWLLPEPKALPKVSVPESRGRMAGLQDLSQMALASKVCDPPGPQIQKWSVSSSPSPKWLAKRARHQNRCLHLPFVEKSQLIGSNIFKILFWIKPLTKMSQFYRNKTVTSRSIKQSTPIESHHSGQRNIKKHYTIMTFKLKGLNHYRVEQPVSQFWSICRSFETPALL